jgi:hypothetical protein
LSKQAEITEIHLLRKENDILKKDKKLAWKDKVPSVMLNKAQNVRLRTAEDQAKFQETCFGKLSRNLNQLKFVEKL